MSDGAHTLSEHERDMLWERISDLEHRGWRELCGGNSAGFYRDLMTDDGLMVFADGSVMDREEVHTALRDAPPWSTFEIVEEKLVTPAADVAVLVYCGTGHRDDGTKLVARMASTYVKDGSAEFGWRLALYTQTPAT